MKKNILGILLIVISVFLIGYGTVSFVFFNGKEEPIEEENPLGIKMTEEELKEFETLAGKYMFLAEYFPISDVSEIPNQYLIRIGIDGVDTSASDVENTVFSYFGSQIKIRHEDYICSFDGEIYFDYDEEEKKYLVAPSKSEVHPHIGSYPVPLKMRYVHADSGYKKDDEYIVNTRILYVCDIDPVVGDFYASFNDCVIENPTPVIENPEHSVPNASYVEFYGDNLPITTFTFYEEGGNYVLKSVVIKDASK